MPWIIFIVLLFIVLIVLSRGAFLALLLPLSIALLGSKSKSSGRLHLLEWAEKLGGGGDFSRTGSSRGFESRGVRSARDIELRRGSLDGNELFFDKERQEGHSYSEKYSGSTGKDPWDLPPEKPPWEL